MASARIEVRLEHREHTARADRRPSGRERRGDLAWVMTVVVVDRDAPGLAAALEAPPSTGELRQHALRLLARDPGELERRQRRGGVTPVVLSRNAQFERRRLQLLPAHCGWRLREPPLEQLAYFRLGGEGGVMIQVDVGDHRNLRP